MRRIRIFLLIITLVASLVPLGRTQAQSTSAPTKVVVAGTHQSELGCSGDWLPDCDKTALTYDEQSDVWTGEFLIQPNNDQDGKGPRYKVAINGSWSENYGAKAQPGGADIPLVVTKPTKVKFYYDPNSHWVADNFNNLIVTAIGDFQTKLGCKQDDDPTCLRSWLEDPEGDGLYTFATTKIPAELIRVNHGDQRTDPSNLRAGQSTRRRGDPLHGEAGRRRSLLRFRWRDQDDHDQHRGRAARQPEHGAWRTGSRATRSCGMWSARQSTVTRCTTIHPAR